MTQGYRGLAGLAKGVWLGLLVAVPAAAMAAPTAPAPKTATIQPATTKASATEAWKPVAPEDAQRQVETYFNRLTTVQAEFTQQVTHEDFGSEGTFYLKRPGKFLWQYDTPVRQKVVGTGTAVYYVDQSSGTDGQVTQLPTNAGLGRLFNAKQLRLKDAGMRVTQARQQPGTLEVELQLEKSGKADGGVRNIRLTFTRGANGTLSLRSSTATDVTGATTRISFRNIQEGANIPSSLFAFTPGVYKNQN